MSDFSNRIYSAVIKVIEDYGYCRDCAYAITAQAVLESGWNGDSVLASAYNNFFGLKINKYWTGSTVYLKTREEINGSEKIVNAMFRIYPDFESGVSGYFDFIRAARYKNLKRCKTAEEYAETIKADGYATSSGYVVSLKSIIAKLRTVEAPTVTVPTNNGHTNAYYPAYTGDSIYLDEILRSVGVPDNYVGNWSRRTALANANGISNYKGTYDQNVKLIRLAKSGKLMMV